MSVAPWRGAICAPRSSEAIAGALHRNRSLVYSRYVQLATIRTDGRPANRTVVFREFLEDTNQLKFITDIRSDKIAHIQHQPWAEVCWYFPNTREQFRITGCLTLVDKDYAHPALQQARITMWQELSDAARLQFGWAYPGKPREELAAFEPPQPDASEPLPNFCLLLLDPVQVDHLELRGEPQNRYVYHRDEAQEWTVEAVNP